jgi:hypothetical protein
MAERIVFDIDAEKYESAAETIKNTFKKMEPDMEYKGL